MQTDPIGYEDQFNLYAYVGNDPINLNDPTGLCGSKLKGVDNPFCTTIWFSPSKNDGSQDANKRPEGGNQSTDPRVQNANLGFCKLPAVKKACGYVAGQVGRRIAPKPGKPPELPNGVTPGEFANASGFVKGQELIPAYTRAERLAQVRNLKNLGIRRSDVAAWRNHYQVAQRFHARPYAEERAATRLNIAAIQRAGQLDKIWWSWTLGF